MLNRDYSRQKNSAQPRMPDELSARLRRREIKTTKIFCALLFICGVIGLVVGIKADSVPLQLPSMGAISFGFYYGLVKRYAKPLPVSASSPVNISPFITAILLMLAGVAGLILSLMYNFKTGQVMGVLAGCLGLYALLNKRL